MDRLLDVLHRVMRFALPALVVATLLGVTAARLIGYDPAGSYAATVESRELRFADQDNGGILVTDATTGQTVALVPPGGDGFLRATMRGLANARKFRGLGDEVPFRLAVHADGQLTLEDPVIGRTLDLGAFGPTNTAAFARFLPTPPPARTASL